jgi:enoyl-CoA hydratase
MTETLVHLIRHDDGVALVEIEHGKANTLSTAVLAQLGEVVGALADDLPGAVVVTGRGRMFAAGAEISEFGGPAEATTVATAFHGALDALAALPRPVIAAVNGYALGGGCELALACDRRIAGERTKMGQPEILLGIIPGGGGTQRLARLVGPSVAKDLVFTGRQVDAPEALALGLVDEVVPDEHLVTRAREYAAALAAGPSSALGLAKRAIDAGLDGTLADGLTGEIAAFEEVFATDDAQIGVASFLEDGPGKAVFTGR